MIDTHQHLIEPDRLNYPWLDDAPQLKQTLDLAEYRRRADGTGIRSTVFMEVDVAESDQQKEAAHFCELADDPSTELLGVIASGRPESSDFNDHLDRIDHPKLVGIRRVLHVVDDSISQHDVFRRHVAQLADRNLTFDFCVRPDQLRLAIDLALEAPRTQFILDHCGNPPLADPHALAAWQEYIARLAELPHVACKVSGLVNHLQPDVDPMAQLQFVLDHVAAHFGSERLMFGGDWPVSLLANVDLSQWVGWARELMSSQSQSTQDAFFSGNAQRIYGLQISS